MAILCLSPNVDSSAAPTHRFRLLASGSPTATAPPVDEPTLIASACQANYLWLPPAELAQELGRCGVCALPGGALTAGLQSLSVAVSKR
jgi:hypothetical protein